MARLVLLRGGEAVPYELEHAETVLGRHPECTVQLDSNMVSRRHACVVRDGDRWIVEDLGSGNGTFVNGQRIQTRTPLTHNDRIKLGPVLLRFESGLPSDRDDARFELSITADPDDISAITSTVDSSSGYGMLDVRPEAKLKGIIEITRSLTGTLELRTLHARILDTLFGIFPHADRGCILLKNPESGEMIPSAQKHRRPDEDATVRLSRTVLDKVLRDKQGILSADAAHDRRFLNSESIANLTIRSMMCVPLLARDGEPLGLISLDTQNPTRQFSSEDLDLLLAVAGQAALAYENARLLELHLEKVQQDRELAIARRVQEALLPAELPQVPGWQFFASYHAAEAVGGDYYDAMLLGGDRICLAFGDVAGKGVPGALIMSRLASCVQNVMAFVQDVGQAVAAINRHMCFNAAEGRFVTFVLAVVDLKSGDMTMVNAGHLPPLIRRADGRVESFGEATTGLPIGILDEYPYQVQRTSIMAGETVVVVTDGVDEAMDPDGRLYGRERVAEFVRSGSPLADELGESLFADVRRHAQGRAQNDDITIMTFGRNP